MTFRSAILAIGAAFWFLGCGVAPAKADPHASALAGAIAGAELCADIFDATVTPRSPAPRGLNYFYERWGWRAGSAPPYAFIGEVGDNFGEAVMAPGVSGRVASAIGRRGGTGGTGCDVMVFDAPGVREALINHLDASEDWTNLRIPDVPNTKMYGRATTSDIADIGFALMWGAGDYEATMSMSFIPKSSITTGVYPPAEE